jgi:histidine ammonia-lyase
MSGHDSQSRLAAGAVELLSVPRFLEELRRVARYGRPLPVGDPLAAAVRRIENSPTLAQSRLLARILTALTYQQGEFRRAEVAALDSETLAMVITLMDAHAAGTSTREDWVRAVDAARAAELGAGG